MTAPTPTKSGTPAMTKVSDLLFASQAPAKYGLEVRKSSDEEGFDKLKASIAAHGVLMPLMVRTIDNKRYVVAGNRRLRACLEIYGNEASVPTLNVEGYKGDVREIAMATNVSLPPHPVDRFEVIADLVADGMKPKDVQARFALDQRGYAQVMKLAEMDPVIRDAWRQDKIDADAAYAFTLFDPKQQAKIYDVELKGAYQGRVQAHSVRSRATNGQHNVGTMVQFVGVRAARDAGITVNEDLFGSSHTVEPKQIKKLQALASNKIDAEAKRLTEVGWSWVITDRPHDFYSYGTIDPATKNPKLTKEQQDRLDEISVRMDALIENEPEWDALDEEARRILEDVRAAGYTAEQRARSGCRVGISSTGEIDIEYGRLRPEQRKRAEAQERKKAAPAGKAEVREPGTFTLTQAMAQRLSTSIQEAAADVLRADHLLGAAALIAGFASGGSTVSVRIGNDAGKKPGNFADVLAATREQSAEQLLVMLAQAAAQAVALVCFSAESMPLNKPESVALLTALKPDAMEKALRMRFDAEAYFPSLPVDAIAAAVAEMKDDDAAARASKMKRADAAKFAISFVQATGWLPPEMRLPTYAGPSTKTKPKKARGGSWGTTKGGHAAEVLADIPKKARRPAKKVAKKVAKKKAKK